MGPVSVPLCASIEDAFLISKAVAQKMGAMNITRTVTMVDFTKVRSAVYEHHAAGCSVHWAWQYERIAKIAIRLATIGDGMHRDSLADFVAAIGTALLDVNEDGRRAAAENDRSYQLTTEGWVAAWLAGGSGTADDPYLVDVDLRLRVDDVYAFPGDSEFQAMCEETVSLDPAALRLDPPTALDRMDGEEETE